MSVASLKQGAARPRVSAAASEGAEACKAPPSGEAVADVESTGDGDDGGTGALPVAPALHRYLLAYASDFSFLETAMDLHGVSWLTPGMQVASLDHAMWFHRLFRFDDWLLYVVDSSSASAGCGLMRGRFFDRGGRLVASTAQEGVIRRRV